ncbi:protein FAM131C isoform X3 [Dermochelys coriacea]|uniref:protein FAM131C isoform X3 n=1 Tax=Dermochelys coriacea TaxID=27794 RepID=UPI0018E87ACA|nr:protein FAM131C isoform X3 [Dermochelys coriacea]
MMGSCVSQEFFTSAQKDYAITSHPQCPPSTHHDSQQVPAAALEKDISKKCFKTSSGILSNSKSGSSGYNVTALATSSLVGLVQTVKDHITKPTAMARGRVAHLIEWKGWSAPQVGCEPWLTEEEQYSYLTDELREARFAAGVAEQFAITEATLSAWSSLDDEEMNYGGSSQEIVQLQDLESIYLQEKLLLSPQVISSPNLEGSLPTCSSSTHTSPIPWGHSGVDRWNSTHPFPGALPCGSPQTGSSEADSSEKEQACVGRGQEGMTSVRQKRLSNSLHDVDSSSLSEDEVFYN